MRSAPDFRHEAAAHARGLVVAGVDEAGRGALAGPVVAAAVILAPDNIPAGVNDSKRLPPETRLNIARSLHANAVVATGTASTGEIDTHNILRAALLAMGRAVSALPEAAGLALIDGHHLPSRLPCPGQTIVGGDQTCLSIAAASIIAKVTRDALMCELARSHPDYGWDRNMAYATPEHLKALACLGPTPHHRRSFRPVQRAARHMPNPHQAS